MAFDVNNFVINRVMRGTMVSPSTGDIQWSITQIKDPTLKQTGESVEAVDALNAPILTINRGKKAEFSGTNSLFDLGLYAAQAGSEKKVASNSNKITAPKFEEFTITEGMTEVTLAYIPVGVKGAEIKQIYELRNDQSLGIKYILGATASETEFKLDAATKKITLPTGLTTGSRLLVRYEYETEKAVAVSNRAIDFPKAGRFILEVLGHDVCAPDVTYYAYVVLLNASLTTDVDISFTTEGTHPFTLKCNQAYCDIEKRLVDIIIPEA